MQGGDLRPGRIAHPQVPFGGVGEDHRHGLAVDGADLGVGLRGQEAEQVTGDLAFLDLAHAGPWGPEAGEEGEGALFAQGKPDRLQGAADLVGLAEGGERHEAAVGGAEPGLPVGTGGVADVGRALVGLHPQQLGKIDVLALGAQLGGARGSGVVKGLL